ncbi:His Kinase A (phospho-acceptor) domain-containing protein [Geoalkalibacter ferrihydriticus]|uniref:histidine kinase n=1 Tax=Geoalkalibacter ferrihydriticus TaxID=392333 RepID=A0A1G9T3U1_9BACT|nr:ATP-binding protein [Geoalkalibacter ferrihydriticus]SDM42351.1 His Kinase A (phospho-acceptor) domain-containing protein [Geoalkalibacter ferrihydriticus]
MNTWLIPSQIASLCGSTVLVLVFASLFARDRKPHLALWAWCWALYALCFVLALTAGLFPEASTLPLAREFCLLASSLLLVAGGYAFVEGRQPRIWTAGALLCAIWVLLFRGGDSWLFLMPSYLFHALAAITTGIIILRQIDVYPLGRHLTGWTFILWGLHRANYPLLSTIPEIAPWGFLLGAYFSFAAAGGVILIHFSRTCDLAEENHRLSQTLLNAIADPLVLIGPDLRIRWSNQGARHLAPALETLPESHCFETWRNRSHPCEPCPARDSFASGTAAAMHLDTKDGRAWEVRSFPVPGSAPGQVSGVILHFENQTPKKENSRQAHLAALGELSAGVAHEINNPINGIINYAELLGDSLPKAGTEVDLARRIGHEAERIATIVRNLLSFARDSQDEKKPVLLCEILLDALVLVETQLRRHGVETLIDLPLDLPPVRVHPQQIQQVFLNLLSNALFALNEKFAAGAAGKHLEISAVLVEEQGQPRVRTCIFDRGTGIAAAHLDKAMNPFFTTKPSGKGTGLGLSISHGIVRDHGGRLTIESSQGEWTRVTLDLPCSAC